MKRFDAFSLPEMVIGLLIAGIVISMAGFALQYLQNHASQWGDFREQGAEFKEGLQVFRTDLERANRAWIDQNDIVLEYDSLQLTYQLGNGLVRFTGTQRDTLLPHVRNVHMHTIKGTALLDTLRLDVAWMETYVPQVFTKTHPYAEIDQYLYGYTD